MGIGRDDDGILTSVDDPADPLESMIFVHADGCKSEEELKTELEKRRILKGMIHIC